MIEKIKSINNPLTIIAIFAALAEIAATFALAAVKTELQGIFIWYVMLFPVFLVLLFFITLNFNPQVLYAPSDFKDEANFIKVLLGRKALLTSFEGVRKQLETAKDEIVEQSLRQIGSAGEIEKNKLTKLINQQIELIEEKLETTKESVENLTMDIAVSKLPRSALQARILEYLAAKPDFISLEELVKELKMNKSATERALSKLVVREVIKMGLNGEKKAYKIIEKNL